MTQLVFKPMTGETQLFIREKFIEAAKLYDPESSECRETFEMAYVDKCMIDTGRRTKLRK